MRAVELGNKVNSENLVSTIRTAKKVMISNHKQYRNKSIEETVIKIKIYYSPFLVEFGINGDIVKAIVYKTFVKYNYTNRFIKGVDYVQKNSSILCIS